MFMNQGELEVVKQETEEGNGTPLQCSCLENPRDGGALWAAIYGVAQSRTRLKRRSSSSHSSETSETHRFVCFPSFLICGCVHKY